LETSLFDNLDDLNISLDTAPVNDEWLDFMRSEFEDNVVKQVLQPESTPPPKSMRRCDSLPAHMQFHESKPKKGISKVSSMASMGSQRNLASMCSEVTITPTSSVPDLLEYERRAAAAGAERGEIGGLGIEHMMLNGSLSPSPWTREDALLRYRRKKANRCFRKKIRYECRRKIASERPRVGGRFARPGDDSPLNDADLAKFVNLEDIPSL